ncbi:MAG: 3'(2'),5'-bisphosphate nucleotidase CysQ [Flavobacteriales bacterium]|nr:3'(2'),5'-bisphosphate nucleotidase CysQ [Flavobacteriales bacterium]
MNKLTQLAIRAAEKASDEILDVYGRPIAVEMKDDRSPLTEADSRAHKVIEAQLLDSGLPLLSEEGSDIPFEERHRWEYFWMVDPLDGTKEFIKRNGEFTVNIALIHDEKPIAGVIYVPVTDVLYFGNRSIGGFKVEGLKKIMSESITTDLLTGLVENGIRLPVDRGTRPVTLVGSRSHMSPETEAFMDEMKVKYGEVEVLSIGSSLKLCMVAEGCAEYYPRFAPTMEWDTAAGQAIVEASGGRVVNWPSKDIMPYNKQNLRNEWFLVESGTVINS